MKKIIQKLLTLTILASTTLLFNCGGDEEEVFDIPTISFSGSLENGGSIAAGESFTLTVTVFADGGFNTLRLDGISINGKTELNRNDSELTISADNKTATLNFNLEAPSETGTIEADFEAVDDKNQIGTATYSITVTSPAARSYSATLLYAPLGDRTGKNFFASSTGTTYSGADVTSTTTSISPLIDFGYYYGASNQASIASPKAFESTVFASQVQNWGTLNETKLRSTTLNAAAFNEVTTWAGLDAAFAAGTTEAGVKSALTVGTVIAFETVAGKRGLVLVKAISGTFNQNDNISIDVKVQETAN